jgi:ribosomal protein S16
MSNFFHNVIRIRKGKRSLSQVYWVIVILNSKKTSSHKAVEQLGFFQYGKKRLFSINYKRLGYFLNKGTILKDSVKSFFYFHSLSYLK